MYMHVYSGIILVAEVSKNFGPFKGAILVDIFCHAANIIIRPFLMFL
jgi:hypothetical protein